MLVPEEQRLWNSGFAQLHLTVSSRRVESRHIANFWQIYIHGLFRAYPGFLHRKRHDLRLVASNTHYTGYTQNEVLTNP